MRLALGARGADVVRMVVASGARLTAMGLILGVAGGAGAARLVGGSLPLYEVEATDPLTYGGVVLILMGVALLAGYLPARKASSVNPVEALRHE